MPRSSPSASTRSRASRTIPGARTSCSSPAMPPRIWSSGCSSSSTCGRRSRPRAESRHARGARVARSAVTMFYARLAAGDPREDELEKDLDSEEGDDLEISGESDLASTECIDQRHIGQGDLYGRDGEMNLASTNGIDQRFAGHGSRTDREVTRSPMTSRGAKGFTEPAYDARAETEAELRKRGLRNRREGNIVELSLWRR